MWGKEQELPYFEHKTEFPNQNDELLIAGAVDLVNHFNKSGLMLPVSIEQYTMLASKGALVVETNDPGKVIGTVAYTQFYKGGVWEFGGWAVAEEFQHQGIGAKLADVLFYNKSHKNTIAFGNKNSAPILEKMGAVVIKDHSTLPVEAFALCATCPMKPAVGCCDTIYSLKPIMLKIEEAKKYNQQINTIGCGR